MLGFGTTVKYKATIQGRVWRGIGTQFLNPATGKMEVAPGGEEHQGREGRWYDHGVLSEQIIDFSAWRWLWQRIRMEIHEIAKFLRGKI